MREAFGRALARVVSGTAARPLRVERKRAHHRLRQKCASGHITHPRATGFQAARSYARAFACVASSKVYSQLLPATNVAKAEHRDSNRDSTGTGTGASARGAAIAGGRRSRDRPRRPCGSRRAAGRAMPIVEPVATALPAANATTARTGMEAASRVRGFPPRRAARWRSAKLPHPAMLTAPALSGGLAVAGTTPSTAAAASAPDKDERAAMRAQGSARFTICHRGVFERRCSAKFAVLSSVVRYSRWRRGLRGRG